MTRFAKNSALSFMSAVYGAGVFSTAIQPSAGMPSLTVLRWLKSAFSPRFFSRSSTMR